MRTVFIAGASGYLGRHLVTAFSDRGWRVRALVRDRARAEAAGLVADEIMVAEATDPTSLCDTMQGADLAVSALGITRQRDGLSYRDVDYQANVNLLKEAMATGVSRFCYFHVLNAEAMHHVPLVAAKQAFVDVLQAAPVQSTVICPGGYFSDMEDFLSMARSGRIWLFGNGTLRLNPIHGADLADATVDAVDAGGGILEVGGPDILSQMDLARLAIDTLDRPVAVTCLPDWLRRASLRLLPYTAPRHIRGPAQFFLTAMGQEMVAECHGHRRIGAHFRAQSGRDESAST